MALPVGNDNNCISCRKVVSPTVRLGRVYGNYTKKDPTSNSNGWELVMITVVSPVESVRSAAAGKSFVLHRLLLIALCAVLLVIVRALVFSSPSGQRDSDASRCAPIHALPHVLLKGDCSGALGDNCTYVGCAEGYKLVPKGSIPTVRPPQRDDAAVVVPPCGRCYGDGLYCELPANSSEQCVACDGSSESHFGRTPKRRQDLLACPIEASGRKHSCVEAGGVVCAASDALPCSACVEPAFNSGWHACELGSVHWNRQPPSNPLSANGDSILGWESDPTGQMPLRRNTYCLSTPTEDCIVRSGTRAFVARAV
jgi:hypothetical protein